MPQKFTASNVVRNGNSLTLRLCFDDTYGGPFKVCVPAFTRMTPEFVINCLVAFQAKVVRYERRLMYCIRFVTKRQIDQLTYTLSYTHGFNEPNYKDDIQYFIKNDCWHLIGEYQVDFCIFYVSVHLNVSARVNPFEPIHSDEELADFELRGEDGTVHFHRAVAAGFSPIIKTELTREWRNDAKCVIDAPPNTAKETLKHLKDYMYSDKLPERSGLKPLLLLASFYVMPDLELRCVLEMLTKVTSKEAYELVEFAMEHRMWQLLFEIMQRVQMGDLSVDLMRKHHAILMGCQIRYQDVGYTPDVYLAQNNKKTDFFDCMK